MAALAAAAFYLVLSGAEVATQRSFIMIAIVLVGVMVDRPAITLRTLTVAAIVVLLLTPEAIVHPSFQMSFAATLALVAGYERGLPWMSAAARDAARARASRSGAGARCSGSSIVSLLAGLATTLFAAYHFHRLAPYGVLANLLAMPVVSLWIMPMGILGVVAMPFGFDGFCWQLMGEGIDWMIAVALWVASLPGAVGRMAAFGIGPLLLGSAGLVVLCLLQIAVAARRRGAARRRERLAARTPQPDVLIAADGADLRGARRRRPARHRAHRQRHLRRPAMARRRCRCARAHRCEPRRGHPLRRGRLHRPPRGRPLVALARSIEAFEEDCRRAAVVASPRDAPADCAALVIDRSVLRRTGAVALRRTGDGFAMTAVTAAGLRPALGAGASVAGEPPHQRRQRAAARRHAAPRTWTPAIAEQDSPKPGDSGRQYRRNRPTSLPWMRTRLGGRMRTS